MDENQLPVSQDSDETRLTYAYTVKARNGKKRDYIYDFSKARKCPHRHLVATAVGGNTYRCPDCNYFYTIVTAYAEPMHLAVVKAAYQLLHFGKEFGAPALEEVLRQPHGQHEDGPQMGVLPDGMTLVDAVLALEQVNVHSPDRGDAEMRALVEAIWPSTVEIKRRIKALRGSDNPEKQQLAGRLESLLEARHALGPGTAEDRRSLPAGGEPRGNGVPPVPEAAQ